VVAMPTQCALCGKRITTGTSRPLPTPLQDRETLLKFIKDRPEFADAKVQEVPDRACLNHSKLISDIRSAQTAARAQGVLQVINSGNARATRGMQDAAAPALRAPATRRTEVGMLALGLPPAQPHAPGAPDADKENLPPDGALQPAYLSPRASAALSPGSAMGAPSASGLQPKRNAARPPTMGTEHDGAGNSNPLSPDDVEGGWRNRARVANQKLARHDATFASKMAVLEEQLEQERDARQAAEAERDAARLEAAQAKR
jgi:hypothetical protein